MKKRSILGLCLGLGMAMAAASAQAEPGKGKALGLSGQSLGAKSSQIQIDRKTGRKTLPDDSPRGADAPARAPLPTDAATSIMPLEAGAVRRHADGSISAELGLRQMKFVTMTIDEDGQRRVEHQSLESFEATTKEPMADKGEK
jgi:hypothetical protein